MKAVSLAQLEAVMKAMLAAVGFGKENAETMVEVTLEKSKCGAGHHDINDFADRLRNMVKMGVETDPVFTQLSAFGCMEGWDGGNGPGELVCSHGMKRAVALAQQHGMGLCTLRNSNHYLASLPYTLWAANNGCIGIIMAKAAPSMGVAGHRGNVISQSPNGFAFPTGEGWPVSLDGCLAYVSSHGRLQQMARAGQSVPPWWGVDAQGKPTTDPTALRQGTRYPIGEHKGFGYAMLAELLCGVLSQGPILDQSVGKDGLANNTSHTAIAIKADALMGMDEYCERSGELVKRVQARAPGIRIPGQQSYARLLEVEQAGRIEVADGTFAAVNEYAAELGTPGLADIE